MGWVVNATPRPLYPRERPGTRCIGGWVGPGAGLDGCGKSLPHLIRSPDRAARSESLYRLSYPGPPLSKYESRNAKLTDPNFRYRPHSRTLTYSLQILRSGLFSLIPNRIQVHIGKEILLILETIIFCCVVRIYKIPSPRPRPRPRPRPPPPTPGVISVSTLP